MVIPCLEAHAGGQMVAATGTAQGWQGFSLFTTEILHVVCPHGPVWTFTTWWPQGTRPAYLETFAPALQCQAPKARPISAFMTSIGSYSASFPPHSIGYE